MRPTPQSDWTIVTPRDRSTPVGLAVGASGACGTVSAARPVTARHPAAASRATPAAREDTTRQAGEPCRRGAPRARPCDRHSAVTSSAVVPVDDRPLAAPCAAGGVTPSPSNDAAPPTARVTWLCLPRTADKAHYVKLNGKNLGLADGPTAGALPSAQAPTQRGPRRMLLVKVCAGRALQQRGGGR